MKNSFLQQLSFKNLNDNMFYQINYLQYIQKKQIWVLLYGHPVYLPYEVSSSIFSNN